MTAGPLILAGALQVALGVRSRCPPYLKGQRAEACRRAMLTKAVAAPRGYVAFYIRGPIPPQSGRAGECTNAVGLAGSVGPSHR